MHTYPTGIDSGQRPCDIGGIRSTLIRLAHRGEVTTGSQTARECDGTEAGAITRPNTVCLLSSHGVGTVVMKNCEPFVFGPALAIESVNGRSCLKFRLNSSGNSEPQMLCPPVPSPSPPPSHFRTADRSQAAIPTHPHHFLQRLTLTNLNKRKHFLKPK